MYNTGELLNQLSEEQRRRVFLSSVTYPSTKSIIDKPENEIIFENKINWKDVEVQLSELKGYPEIVKNNFISIIEMMEIVSEQLLPEVFDQIIIANHSMIPLSLKSKTNNSGRCISIDVYNFHHKLTKEIERSNIDLTPTIVIGALIFAGYLIITA